MVSQNDPNNPVHVYGENELPPSYDNSVSPTILPVNSASTLPIQPPPRMSSRQNSSGFLKSLKGKNTLNEKGNGTPSGNSSGSTSRTATPKNVPYRPSPEQQVHIDLLSQNTTSLTSVTSRTQSDYFDVLPSFQMFQSILKRDDTQFNENLTVNPPIYGDTRNSSPSPPESLTPTTSHRENTLDSQLDAAIRSLAVADFEEEYLFEDDEGNEQIPHNERAHNHNVSVTTDHYGASPLDNIDRLPKSPYSPLDIQIFVTKKVPQPNFTNELETRLKEYTSGDIVNGYITITNTSDNPVDFGLFTVSLEGTIKATERNLNSSILDAHKYKKILMKKFLKMYDLNASYGYVHIPNSAGIEYEAFTTDLSDGCQIGLPNDRVLMPQCKYKKFFTFKFPNKLLDNSCMNGVLSHILPPPSMGIDKTCFYNRGESIQLNKSLGYGFLNVRGTPLLTKDYSFEDVSVSYTIEAKIIDHVNSKNKDPLSQHEINDLNSASEYAISSSSQYFLRFIPDLKDQIKYYNQEGGSDSFGIGIDGKLFRDHHMLRTWKLIQEYNYRIEKEIDERLNNDEYSTDDLKRKNMIITPTEISENLYRSSNDTANNFKLQDPDHFYEDERMIGSKSPITVYGKKKKLILSFLVKIGTLKLYVRVPKRVISYSSPKLLMKYNNGDEAMLAALTQSVSASSDASLRPVSSVSSSLSNVTDLYNRDVDDIINSIDLSLVFNPTETTVKPPQISYIETNIIFWSYNADYPLPYELGYDFFYTNPEQESQRGDNSLYPKASNIVDPQSSNPIHPQSSNKSSQTPEQFKEEEVYRNPQEDEVQTTRKNLQTLKDQALNYINFLKSSGTYLSKNSFLYLKGIKSLGVKKDSIKDYYKTLTAQSHPEILNNEGGWVAHQVPSETGEPGTSNKSLKWIKNFSIPLEPINKNNVNLIPSFQNCLVGRIYCLQVVVKFKGSNGEQNEFADNVVRVDVPILVG